MIVGAALWGGADRACCMPSRLPTASPSPPTSRGRRGVPKGTSSAAGSGRPDVGSAGRAVRTAPAPPSSPSPPLSSARPLPQRPAPGPSWASGCCSRRSACCSPSWTSRVQRLPDVLTLSLAGAALALLAGAAAAPEHAGDWLTALYGALALGGGYFVLFLINPNGMGFGDVKLALGPRGRPRLVRLGSPAAGHLRRVPVRRAVRAGARRRPQGRAQDLHALRAVPDRGRLRGPAHRGVRGLTSGDHTALAYAGSVRPHPYRKGPLR